MTEQFYVATDLHGVEHAADGPVVWRLPAGIGAATTERPRGLVLRTTNALLEVLDEVIYRAEPVGDVATSAEGTVRAPAAQLVERTRWGTELATRFALACAGHALGDKAEVPLPDGTPLGQVVTDAQKVLEEGASSSRDQLGYLGGLKALWHLHRQRSEISEISLGLMVEDEKNGIEALDDPAYAAVIPLVDAVLAAIEALRHHLLPKMLEGREDRREEAEQHANLDGLSELRPASVIETQFGSEMVGGGPPLGRFEPAWTSAREAAHHARMAARDVNAAPGEDAERAWQAATLDMLLAVR